MIRIVYRTLVKKGREKEFKQLTARVLIPQATSVKGCIKFSVFENQNNPREFMFYELWKDQKSIEECYKKFIKILDKNSHGKVFPDKLNDFFEEDGDIVHQEIKETEI